MDVLFAKQVPARKFATTDVDAFDEHDNNQLAARYSVAGAARRPSFVPSVTNALASHGRAEDALAQRRASVATGGNARRPSIADAVTNYIEKN